MGRNLLVALPSPRDPIKPSPGFAKKELATWKLDLVALCGFGCRYCSSSTGNYLRINREKFADATEAQLGRRLYPATSPELAMVWPDVIARLDEQLDRVGPGFGAGETLVFSMLTDAFSGPPLRSHVTEEALQRLIERTSFRVRVLTKNSVVGLSRMWVEYFHANLDRVVVGLSTGTLDDEWARRVEVGCPPPSARTKATRYLQALGVPTFGMLCPIFPDAMTGDGDGVADLVEAIRPNDCETVWAEPYNDRANWRAVQAGYDQGSPGWEWFENVYGENGSRAAWSRYATELYLILRDLAEHGGWLHKLRYLLYEDGVTNSDAEEFGDLRGVLLQSPTDAATGRSMHPVFARLQSEAG